MPLATGSRLGPYEIVAPLGAGGMGEVYRARDTRLGREVAVKVLPQQLSASSEIRARFEREARTVSALAHPHICALYDVGREGDVDYLVMELLEGETLAARLERGALPVEQLLALGVQIAGALAQAHRAGIVHRDLKPGNIMLTRAGAKLMDFGLARPTGLAAGGAGSPGWTASLAQSPTQAAPLTAEGTLVGTFQYMSPEQLEGSEADERSDVWALGCVLYEMASGQPAFSGASPASLIAAVMSRAPQPLPEVAPLAPPRLGRLIAACLARDPEERVQTAHDVALQLEWIRGELSGAGPAPRTVSPARRWPTWTGATAAVLAASALAFVAGRRLAPTAAPAEVSFERMTFDTQAIFNARFLPNGHDLVFSAAREGNRPELFVLRAGSPVPQPLGVEDAHLLAVSPSGELAVLVRAGYTGHHRLFTGTLARMPLEGGAPRELLEAVREADWGPGGRELAVIHDVGGRDRLEYPIGTVLYESAGYLSDPRFSPRGDRVAFMEHPSRFDDRGAVAVVDLAGRSRVLSAGFVGIEGLAWSPDGGGVYFSGSRQGADLSVFGTDLDGRTWRVLSGPGVLTLQDIARDGTWAVTREELPSRMMFRAASGAETDLSWLDGSLAPVLAADARTLLFTDQNPQAGVNYAVALRPTAGGAVVRLGEGQGSAFSADGRQVLALVPSTPPRVMSYPTGAGQAVRLDPAPGRFENLSAAAWLPGDQSVLVAANEPGRPARCYRLEPAAGTVTAVGPEGIRVCAPSPGGGSFLAEDANGWAIYPLAGQTPPRALPALTAEDVFVRWSPDGLAVYCFHRSEIPAHLDRVEVATGRRTTEMTLAPADRAGLVSILGVSLADDLRSVAYTGWYYRSQLYQVTGAR